MTVKGRCHCGATQFEVAEVLGVSPARVCQMHREAMTILRRELRVA